MRPILKAPPAVAPMWQPALRALIRALTVVGLIFGILAMHSMGAEGSGHGAANSADSSDHMGNVLLSSSEPALASTASDCEESCTPIHESVLVLCILALLFTSILIANLARSELWSRTRDDFRSAPDAAPPHVRRAARHTINRIELSISRT